MSAQLCAAALATALTPGQLPSPPGTVAVERAGLGEFALASGGVVFNNFQLVEQRVQPQVGRPQVPGHELAVRGTYRNRTTTGFDYTLVVVGLDAGGEPLWACTILCTARSNSVGVVEVLVPVPEDTLQQTATVRFRARNASPAFRMGVGVFGGS